MSGHNTSPLFIFLLSALALFLEMSLIRWLPAHVPYLTFFTNMIMLGSFLGLSLGFLAASHRRDFFVAFPSLLALTMAGAIGVFGAQNGLKPLIDVGSQNLSPQELFFGTEFYFNRDLASFRIPIEWLAGFFFLCVALSFIGIGQALGRALEHYPRKLVGYSWNIVGSIAGIALFAVLSYLQAPPFTWFLMIACLYAVLFIRCTTLRSIRNVLLLLPLLYVGLASTSQTSLSLWQFDRTNAQHLWSPYYAIRYHPDFQQIDVNNIGHQSMVPLVGNDIYSIPYLLRRDTAQPHAPAKKLKNVLIIGAGSGNDISRALLLGAQHVDAVEIDPVIADLGEIHHPLSPYADPRVTTYIMDGREFLRHPPRHYDLIIFALVDSLVLHSSYANLRLESFLFTQESFADAKAALVTDGQLVIYNYYRKGWVAQRLAMTLDKVFQSPPIVFSLFGSPNINAETQGGFTLFFAGHTSEISDRLSHSKKYHLSSAAVYPNQPSGFDLPPRMRGDELQQSTIMPNSSLHIATDDWPYLYLHTPIIPALNINGIMIMLGIGIGLIMTLLPQHAPRPYPKTLLYFFLGTSFMLLTSHTMVRVTLLLGTSWITFALVSIMILSLALIGNLWVAYRKPSRTHQYFLALFGMLILSWGLTFISASPVITILMLPLPVLFSGIIFSICWNNDQQPAMAMGYNIAGALVGGWLEYSAMVIGSEGISILAFIIYFAAWLCSGVRLRPKLLPA